MTSKLDLTAVALRRSPTVRFEGPFTLPNGAGNICAVVDGVFMTWAANGMCNLGGSIYDLVPPRHRPQGAAVLGGRARHIHRPQSV